MYPGMYPKSWPAPDPVQAAARRADRAVEETDAANAAALPRRYPKPLLRRVRPGGRKTNHGIPEQRDWFDFLGPSQLLEEAERAMLGPPLLDDLGPARSASGAVVGRAWGLTGIGTEIIGDRAEMITYVAFQEKRRLARIASRLPIWC